MPALDLNLRAANAVVIDISAATPQNTAALNLGKSGLPDQLYLVVVITDPSAQAVTPVEFRLQFTDDNGTTWHTVGTITANVVSANAAFAVPVGLASFAPEGIASANIDVRVQTTHVVVASGDDITYDAYLAGPQSFPFFN